MALKAVIKQLTDVDEPLRPLYKEVDGQFALQVEGGTAEDQARLQAALNKERTSREALANDLEKLKEQIDGLDPEKARAALKKLREIEEKKLVDEGKVDELVANRTKALQDDFAAKEKRYQEEIAARDGKIGMLGGSLKKLTLDGAIRQVGEKAGVKPEAIADVVARFTSIGVKDGIRWDHREIDGQLTTIAFRANNGKDEVVYGKDPSKPMGFDEGIELLREEAPHLFAPSSGSGAPGSGATRFNGSVIRLTREEARNPQRYQEAKAQAAKTGARFEVEPPGPGM
jgi:hypothetical protein